MYIPPSFEQSDPAVLHDCIERHNFGLLVSTLNGELFATHLPFLLQRAAGPAGHLLGHVARANPHWQELDGRDVLAVFSGPHAYVSPTWYESADVVPTWNYVAVHAYGSCRLLEEPQEVAQLLSHTVAVHERLLPNPWTFDPDCSYIQKLLRAVVGFRIEIHRLEGKWKLNQNHPAERRAKAANALAQGDEDARAIARLMRAGLPS